MSNEVTILLVDDVKLTLEIQKNALSRAACRIFTATSGDEALAIVSEVMPDLIVLDLFMPGMKGDECCKVLKGLPEFKHIPIIISTMYDKGESEEKLCLSYGCDGIIRKPFNPTEFLKKLESYLNITIREYSRTHVCVRVDYRIGDRRYEGHLHDISEGGLFIECRELLEKGALLMLEFQLPNNDLSIECEASTHSM
ncbi:MAG: response regulator [Deltaproteobacteria bacterium]|nr:response regulator [Deltaproteobacteria bacterium]